MDHSIVLFLIFWGISIVFHNDYTIYIPTNKSIKVLFFSYLANTCYLLTFDKRYRNRCDVISCCGFDLHFPESQWCWAPFCIPVGSFVSLLWRNVYAGHLLIFFILGYLLQQNKWRDHSHLEFLLQKKKKITNNCLQNFYLTNQISITRKE